MRIEAVDGRINAFAQVDAPGAREQATEAGRRLRSEAPRLLEGLPLAIKDNRRVEGLEVSRGSRAVPEGLAAGDSLVVARLRAHGAVIVGKTALPEFAAIPVTESARLGVTRNPWALDRTPGGSSGGSAAAVAAGMVPAAEGNDGAGSLRIPASCCGLFALKPSRGRIPLDPDGGDGLGGMVSEGFLTRTVADSALLLDAVAGAAPGDPYPPAPPRLPYAAACALPPPRLRVGWTVVPPIEVEVDPGCQAAVVAAVELLAGLGHTVEEVEPGWRRPEVASEFRLLWAAAIRLALLGAAAEGGDPDRAEAHTLALANLGQGLGAAEYLGIRYRLQALTAAAAALWDDWDLILTPSLAQLPLPVGQLLEGEDDRPLEVPERADRFSPFSAYANLSGQPAAQLPLHWHEGLPVGVQLIGRGGEEGLLLGLAQELEEASGWPARRPNLG